MLDWFLFPPTTIWYQTNGTNLTWQIINSWLQQLTFHIDSHVNYIYRITSKSNNCSLILITW